MENWTETGLHAAVPVLVRKTIDGCDNVNTPWQRRTNAKKRNERNKSGWVFWARSTNVQSSPVNFYSEIAIRANRLDVRRKNFLRIEVV
jgi:hypothetical protein